MKVIKISLIVVIFMFSAVVLEAQDMPKILDLHIAGNKNVSESAIIAKIKTRPNQIFSQQMIDEDIKRLYATGFFTDIVVDAKEESEGVIIIFYVKEAPYVDNVAFKGNRIFREDQIKKWIKTTGGQFFDKWQLRTDIEEIKLKYQERGFADVDIDYDVDIDPDNGKTSVVFNVREGTKVRIRKIELAGVESFRKKRILKLLKTRNKTWFRSGVYKEEVFRDDLLKIESFYKREGYLDVKVSDESSSDAKGRLILTIRIDEGKQYKVGEISLEGNSSFPFDQVKEAFSLSKDSIFSYDALKLDTQGLQDFYFNKGYIRAQIETAPAINSETGLVDIRYSVAENDIHYLNKVDIKGNTKTKDIVIRRELKIYPGEQFDGSKIKRSRQRLENLGYFEEIDFDIVATEEENREDLLVRVKESKTGEFSFGAGYSSVDEFIGFVELSQRNFDITNPPTFTGGGQRITLRTEIGTRRNDYDLSFTEPWIFGYPYLFGLDLYQHSRDRASDIGYDWDEKRQGIAFRLGKEISEYNSLFLRMRFDKLDISNVAEDVSDTLKGEAGKKNIYALKLTFARDKRDNIFDPVRGYYFSSSIENAGGFMSGDVDFLRQTNQLSYFMPLGEKLVLNFRLNSGIIDTQGSTSSVPLYERFFAGGAYSVRGYSERSIGPKDKKKTSDPVGGEALLVGNVELTLPIYENIKGAFFYDVGNVWKDKKDFGSGEYKSSIGCGLRLNTPIGPIKLDYGYPLDSGDNIPSNGKVHFSMGHSF